MSESGSPHAAAPAHEGALARLARLCARHRWGTIVVWVILAVGIAVSSATIGGTLVDEFKIPDADSQRAADLLNERFPELAGDAATLVFAPTGEGDLRGDAARRAITTVLAGAGRLPDVEQVGDPFTERAGALSENGRIARADIQFGVSATEIDPADVERLQDEARAALEGSGVRVEFTGPVIQAVQAPETGTSELLGLLAAVIILVLMLGGAVAAGLPILLALLSVGLGLSLLTLAAALTTFNTIAPVLATMLGLGVGIDYALFIVTRFRQAIHDGHSAEDAAALATATAGRAVVFAGATVAISISALAVIGLDFITKLGLGAAITVATAVAAAITLLPAILSLLGHRIDALKIPFIPQSDDSEASRAGNPLDRWGHFVTRHARAVTVVTLAVLAVLAIPVASVHLGASDAGSSPPSTTTRQAYDLLAEGFGPGFNGPLLVAVEQDPNRPAADRVFGFLATQPDIAFAVPPAVNEAGDTAVIIAFPTTSPQSRATQELVERLRADPANDALEAIGARAYVGGNTAAFEDVAAQISARMPLFLLAVIGITFLLLSMAFRSVVIAIKASLTTLLSAMASFGVLVAVFQWGWLQGLIGLDRTGPIESFVPVIVFSILFGLSMDYEVFLVSRIREEYTMGRGARPAITHGIAAIGRVVVAAALIMSVVFLSFLLGEDRMIKEFGLALGMAILIDAFVVRLCLVPAVMHLLGERAWYMPRWLDRVLPNLTIEPPRAAAAEAATPADPPRGPAAG